MRRLELWKCTSGRARESEARGGASWSSPAAELAVFTTVAIAAGVLAAIVPARRASRINVLNALQYE